MWARGVSHVQTPSVMDVPWRPSWTCRHLLDREGLLRDQIGWHPGDMVSVKSRGAEGRNGGLPWVLWVMCDDAKFRISTV